jgi:hypothetical protein
MNRYIATILAVASALLPAAALGQVTLGPDHALDSAVSTTAANVQDRGAIAFGGGVYCVIWRTIENVAPSQRVLAARFDTSGTPIDSAPILIEAQTVGNSGLAPAVAFDGTQFILVWQSAETGNIARIRMRPLGTSGPLPGGSFPLELPNTATATQFQPSVAGGGGKSLVVYEDAATDRIRGALLSGTTLQNSLVWPPESAYRTSSEPNPEQHSPAVAFGNGRFLVAWVDINPTDNDDLYAVPVLADGTLTNSTIFRVTDTAAPGNSFFPHDLSIAFGGGAFLVVYSDGSLGDFDIYGRIIDNTGVPAGATFTISTTVNNQRRPQVAFGGGSFLAVWENIDASNQVGHLYGTQISATGTLLRAETPVESLADSPLPMLDMIDSRAATLASDGTNFLVAWRHDQVALVNTDDMLGSRISSSDIAATTPPVVLSFGPNVEQHIAAASNGTVNLVVWEDTRNFVTTGLDILAARVNADGMAIDTTPILVAHTANDEENPTIAAMADGDFLIAWTDTANSGDIRAARVSPQGTVRDAGGIGIATTAVREHQPAVAAGSDGWIVTWIDTVAGLLARKVAADGTPASGTTTVDGSGVDLVLGAHASAAFAAPHYLVVYESVNRDTIKGAWLDAAGAKTGTLTVSMGASSGSRDRPWAAGGAGRAVAAWHQPSQTANQEVIVAALFADAATTALTSPAAFIDATGSRRSPRVAIQDDYVATTWTESMAGVDSVHAARGHVATDMGTTRLDVIESGGFALATGTGASRDSAIALMADGRTVFAFEEDENTPIGIAPVPRLHTRSAGIHDLGSPCQDAAGCNSGFCADGVCCERACDGVCERCGGDGTCNLAPLDDSRCPETNCSSRSTECVTYVSGARCEAAGVCRVPGDPAACKFSNNPDGVSCHAPGCTGGMGSCMGGECVCGSLQPGNPAASVAPEFANPGCQVAPGSRAPVGMIGLLIALGIVSLWRRRAGVMLLALLLCRCADDPGGLVVRVDLGTSASHLQTVRFILVSDSATGFPAAATMGGQPAGVRVFDSDVDGDGRPEAVIDVDKAYIRSNSLAIELAARQGGSFRVSVRAWGLDADGNRVASAIPGSETVVPGEHRTLSLAMTCLNGCDPAAAPQPATKAYGTIATAPGAMGGIAIGRLTKPSTGHDVAIGLPGGAPGGSNVRAEVVVLVAPTTTSAQEVHFQSDIDNDRAGTALATGDVDGDGIDDLIVGAPGRGMGAGAIYVISGRATWPNAPPTTPAAWPATPLAMGTGTEQMGSALAVADVDGDGKIDIVAGAPYAQTVHILRGAGGMLDIGESALAGFGQILAAAGNEVVVGVPAQNKARLYRVSGGAANLLYDWSAPASNGGFGSAVALADVDGDGSLAMIVAAPAEGGGAVYVLRAKDRSGAQGNPFSAVIRSNVAGSSGQAFGSSVGRLAGPAGFGDSIAGGTHGVMQELLVVSGSSLASHPFQSTDGASAHLAGHMMVSQDGSQLGSPLSIGDVDGDGTDDLIVPTPSQIFIFRGQPW